MYVCLCKAVTDHQIRDAVEQGVTSFEGIQSELAVSTVCGSCACEVKQVIEGKLKSELGSRLVVENSFGLAIA